MYECLLLIIHHYDHFHTTMRTFFMVSGFVAYSYVNYYCNLNYLIPIVIILFLFLDCHGLSLYVPFPVIEICERYFRNLKLRSF